MQRVAAELDYTKMARYRYVTGKAELLTVMIEEAVGEPPDLGLVARGWQEKLTEWARCMWRPGAGTRGFLEPSSAAGSWDPGETSWTECAIATLAGTGLTGREQMDAVTLLSGHIRATRPVTVAGTQPWTTGLLRQLLTAHASRYPATAAAMATAPTGVTALADDTTRPLGLTCILDGLGKLIAERSPAERDSPAP